MIILGVDPGLNITGYGLVNYQPRRTQFIAGGAVKVPRKASFSDKLVYLNQQLGDVVRAYRPDVAVFEETYSNRNPRTSLLLGHARGALIVAAGSLDVPVAEYAARFIKKALTGNGGATKEQVRFMVMNLLKLQELPAEMDVSDALAAALTHCHQLKFKAMQSTDPRPRRK